MPKRTQKVTDVERLLSQMSELCDTGYALAIHIRYTRPSLLYRTYGQAWIDHYSENGYMLTDPVVRWGLGNTGLLPWAALEGDDPAGVLARARDFGLRNGVVYAVGPAGSRTIAGLTRSGAPFTEADLTRATGIVDRIHALTDGIEQTAPEELEALRLLT